MALDPKLNKFTTASQAIASYNFTDIESGLGYVDYYSMTTDLTSGVEYILSDRIEYSTLISTKRTGAGTSTLTFDSSVFNKPKTAKGSSHTPTGRRISSRSGSYTADGRLIGNLLENFWGLQGTQGAGPREPRAPPGLI